MKWLQLLILACFVLAVTYGCSAFDDAARVIPSVGDDVVNASDDLARVIPSVGDDAANASDDLARGLSAAAGDAANAGDDLARLGADDALRISIVTHVAQDSDWWSSLSPETKVWIQESTFSTACFIVTASADGTPPTYDEVFFFTAGRLGSLVEDEDIASWANFFVDGASAALNDPDFNSQDLTDLCELDF